ncbi:hypothetical protein LSTR_LSTR012441, partial [Laodelphax striatellus]
ILCSDVRDRLFGPNEFSRRDLGVLNIMRGRDNGVPDYNTVRSSFRLSRHKTWMEINPDLMEKDPDLMDALKAAYGEDVDNIDLYIGGMLESKDGPGELFSVIIMEQFQRLRTSDRFWFENVDNGIFTAEEIADLRKVKLWDVIVNATDVPPDAIQKNAFYWGSELAYIYACVFLGFVPLICGGAGYGVIKLQNKRRRQLRMKQEEEWLHANHRRLVKVRFWSGSKSLHSDRKGEKLRSVSFKIWRHYKPLKNHRYQTGVQRAVKGL